jgi:methylglutaconyl-CoA hydratase
MNLQTLELQRDGDLASVWLNRPAVHNAFDDIAIDELTRVFRMLGEDRKLRVIVLAARGPLFSAGADLEWMKKIAAYSDAENLADARRLADMLRTVHQCPHPVIAKVQGDCYGGALGLVAAADVAVAAEHANFCLSEVKLGLIPATISPYLMQAIGVRAGNRYMLTGERFSAREAHRIGLLHEVAPSAQLDAVTDAIVAGLRAASPDAVRATKRLVRELGGQAISDAVIDDTAMRIASARASVQGKEGVQAFLEKRKPFWLD